jgi:hypothetical protein
MIGDAVLGVVLWLGPLVARPGTRPRRPASTPPRPGPSGAGILWIGGDLIGLPFILIVVNRLSREDSRRAAVVDADWTRAGPDGAVVGERSAAGRAVRGTRL